jgi:hypothetical protein
MMLHRSTRLEIGENQHHRDDIRAAGIILDISGQRPGGAAPHRYPERGYPTPVMLRRWVATAVVSRRRADTHRQCRVELACRHELTADVEQAAGSRSTSSRCRRAVVEDGHATSPRPRVARKAPPKRGQVVCCGEGLLSGSATQSKSRARQLVPENQRAAQRVSRAR